LKKHKAPLSTQEVYIGAAEASQKKERNPTNSQKPKALKPKPSRSTAFYNT
jgi:hypothetical protein